MTEVAGNVGEMTGCAGLRATTHAEQFWAFDRLPRPIRDALNDGPLCFCAVDVEHRWQRSGLNPHAFSHWLRGVMHRTYQHVTQAER